MCNLKSKLKEVIELEWNDDDKEKLETLIKNAIYYKFFLSKALEQDIINYLDICIKEKRELDEIRTFCEKF